MLQTIYGEIDTVFLLKIKVLQKRDDVYQSAYIKSENGMNSP